MDQGNLVYFDTGYFRKLVKNPKNSDTASWQEYQMRKIYRRLLPFASIKSEAALLEHLHVDWTKVSRYQVQWKDFGVSEADLATKKGGQRVIDKLKSLLDAAQTHYARQEFLKLRHLFARYEEIQKQHSRDQFARLLTEKVIYDHLKRPSIEEDISLALSIDDVQRAFSNARLVQEYFLILIQLLRDLLYYHARGPSASFFRLLLAINNFAEKKNLIPCYHRSVSLKGRSDLGDADYLHFALCGGYNNGELRPVTVLCCEKNHEKLKERLAAGRGVLSAILDNQKILGLLKLEGILIPVKPGRVWNADERLMCTKAINLASENLVLSYPAHSAKRAAARMENHCTNHL